MLWLTCSVRANQNKTKKKKKQKTQFRHKTKQFCHKRKKKKKNHSGTTTTNQSVKCLMGEPAVNHWGNRGTKYKRTRSHLVPQNGVHVRRKSVEANVGTSSHSFCARGGKTGAAIAPFAVSQVPCASLFSPCFFLLFVVVGFGISFCYWF